jgi:hypothetical protein
MTSDPRQLPSFVVRLEGDPGVGKTTLAAALADFPHATDDDLARLEFVEDAGARADATVWVVRGAPDEARGRAEAVRASASLLVAVHARDLDRAFDDAVREAWGLLVGPERVYLTSTPASGSPAGIDELRAALLELALRNLHVPIDRARLAKRPYATAIIGGAALVTAGEGLLPGAAAFVVATQVGAITSLYYLYTGRWMGRSQALSLLPVFASEAAGGSAFLLVKSFLPPTGVADVVAAGVAATMTIAMLGAVTWALEHGYSLEQKSQLKQAFRRMKARSRAERAEIARNRHRWKDKAFWSDLVRRMVFE